MELCQNIKLSLTCQDWGKKDPFARDKGMKSLSCKDFKDVADSSDTGIRGQWTLVGKPMDETFYNDYKEALLDIIEKNNLSI